MAFADVIGTWALDCVMGHRQLRIGESGTSTPKRGGWGWKNRRLAGTSKGWRRHPYLSTNHHTRTLPTSSTNSTMAVTRTMLSRSFVCLCAAVSFRYAPVRLLKLLMHLSAG